MNRVSVVATLTLILVFAKTASVPSAEAQAPAAVHPSVVNAGQQLKAGLIDDAVASLRIRLEAAPEDCQALGLMALVYVQQHDGTRTKLSMDRLAGVPVCAATA